MAKEYLAPNVLLTKTIYEFDNNQKVMGIVIKLAPKLSKFIALYNTTTKNNDNLELLQLTNDNLYSWFKEANVGDSITLEYIPVDK